MAQSNVRLNQALHTIAEELPHIGNILTIADAQAIRQEMEDGFANIFQQISQLQQEIVQLHNHFQQSIDEIRRQ